VREIRVCILDALVERCLGQVGKKVVLEEVILIDLWLTIELTDHSYEFSDCSWCSVFDMDESDLED
jgi:hypothetical protein